MQVTRAFKHRAQALSPIKARRSVLQGRIGAWLLRPPPTRPTTSQTRPTTTRIPCSLTPVAGAQWTGDTQGTYCDSNDVWWHGLNDTLCTVLRVSQYHACTCV